MKKTLIIGLGSGRCGTTSLAGLLDKQKRSFVTHELNIVGNNRKKTVIPWNTNFCMAKKYIDNILSRKRKFVGDVALYWLNYTDFILNTYSKDNNIKFICLKRPKDEVIRSFMYKTAGFHRWIDHDGSKYVKDKWDKAFPKYNDTTLSKADTIGKYYDEYYSILFDKINKYGNDIIKLYNTVDLNNYNKVCEILSFVGYKNPNCITNIKLNIKK